MPVKPSCGGCCHVLIPPDVVWFLFNCNNLFNNAAVLATLPTVLSTFTCLTLPNSTFSYCPCEIEKRTRWLKQWVHERDSCLSSQVPYWVSEETQALHLPVSLGRTPGPRTSHQEGSHPWEQREWLTFIIFPRGTRGLKASWTWHKVKDRRDGGKCVLSQICPCCHLLGTRVRSPWIFFFLLKPVCFNVPRRLTGPGFFRLWDLAS